MQKSSFSERHSFTNFFFSSSFEAVSVELKNRLLIVGLGSTRNEERACPLDLPKSGPGRRDINRFFSFQRPQWLPSGLGRLLDRWRSLPRAKFPCSPLRRDHRSAKQWRAERASLACRSNHCERPSCSSAGRLRVERPVAGVLR